LALRELATLFGKVGFKQFNTAYVDERNLEREDNLILLGGLDTNQVTKDAMDLIKPGVTIYDPGPGIAMEAHDLAYEQRRNNHGAHGEPSRRKYKATAEVDYGMIIRARNPFNPSKAIIIIAGAYGYGSWGALTLIQQEAFLKKCEQLDLSLDPRAANSAESKINVLMTHAWAIVSGKGIHRPWSPLECLFKVRIFDERPLAPEILVFRSLS